MKQEFKFVMFSSLFSLFSSVTSVSNTNLQLTLIVIKKSIIKKYNALIITIINTLISQP